MSRALVVQSWSLFFDQIIIIIRLCKSFLQASFFRILLSPGLTMLDLGNKLGCFRDERDVIRIITAGGFRVNEVQCKNTEEFIIPGKHILKNNTSIVRVGKKQFFVVEWT